MPAARVVLFAIPGGIDALAREAGVSKSRVSQVLRTSRLPPEWASLIAQLAGCSEWEVYEQLGQRSPVSEFGPLFDSAPRFSDARSPVDADYDE
jgi:transcriptional regulator with XRE-family HTH domain